MPHSGMTVWLSNGTISLKRIQSEKCHQILGQICKILLLKFNFSRSAHLGEENATILVGDILQGLAQEIALVKPLCHLDGILPHIRVFVF